MSTPASNRNQLLRRLYSGYTIVETSLNRAEFRWKWLLFWQRTFGLGIVLSALLLLFGGAMLGGWITSKTAALIFFMGLGVLGFLSWLVLIIVVAARSPDRNWLASTRDRVDHAFLDRFNSLLFLG